VSEKTNLININDVTPISVEFNNLIWGKNYNVTEFDLLAGWRSYNTALVGYNTEGVIELRTQEKSIVISPGMFVYIPAYVIHQQIILQSKLSGSFISVPADKTDALSKNISVLQSSRLLADLFQKIAQLNPAEQRTETENQWVEAFLSELRQTKTATPMHLPMPTIPSLRHIAKNIINQPEDMNGLDYWAKEAAMSRRSFTRHFNKETGLSFVIWRQLAKVYAAIHQLSQGKTVKEVSSNLGYKDSSTFIALFRKTFGMSPKKYFQNIHLHKKNLLLIALLAEYIAIQLSGFDAWDEISCMFF